MICNFTRVPQAWVVTDADADTDVLRWSEWDDLARRSHCRVQRRESAAPLGSSTTPSITLRHQHHHLSPSLHRGLTPPTPLHNGLTPGKEGHATRRPQYVISAPALAPNCFAVCCLPFGVFPYTQPCSRCASYQITCANLWRLQSCPTRNQPRTSRMLTCPVCDWTALRVWLPCTDAMLKAQWQARCPWLL